ncbi:recombinase family protein [Brevibacillus porteri]|uniref:recombinase family protein n=1 Tax=Brevibacillus porteri TaxID=2126350 RepID=UPI0036371E48
MRVAAYIRVSTDEQADKGNSLVEQKERLNAYCIAMGWDAPELFIDDGYSAKDLKRPAIKQVMKRIENNEFDVVLTSKLDRLCRNLLDLLQVIDLFSSHNCGFVSASEHFDTSTAVGRMTLQLLGTFAEFERERISERVKDNMLSLAKNSDKILTQPCYGYDIVDGRFVINEAEAAFIEFMFDLAEEGHGHRAIAKELNLRGSATKRGKMWDQTNVRRLMSTETISGTMVYNKRQTKNGKTVLRSKDEWIVKEDNHPAIIPLVRYNKVQDIFNSRKKARKHADSETYLLTGLLKCHHCGQNMRGNTARQKTKYGEYTYYRYMCSSYNKGYGCKHHMVHRDDFEALIINEIKAIKSSSTKNINIKVAAPASISDEIKDVNSQLSKVDKKMQKQIEAYENDLISAVDLKIARERVELERNQLMDKLEKLKGKSIDIDTIKNNAKRALDDIAGIDRTKAKSTLRLLIDQIELENGELVNITWKQ